MAVSISVSNVSGFLYQVGDFFFFQESYIRLLGLCIYLRTRQTIAGNISWLN